LFFLFSSLLIICNTIIITMHILRAAAGFLSITARAMATYRPGFDDYYNDYRGNDPPWPGNEREPIMPAGNGPPGPDDNLFQNLLSAEWAIFGFYQKAVEMFNASTFTDIGLPATTYDRIQEIRNNEAGHLVLFRDNISGNSIKPGPCEYQFGFKDAKSFITTMTLLEIASMAPPWPSSAPSYNKPTRTLLEGPLSPSRPLRLAMRPGPSWTSGA